MILIFMKSFIFIKIMTNSDFATPSYLTLETLHKILLVLITTRIVHTFGCITYTILLLVSTRIFLFFYWLMNWSSKSGFPLYNCAILLYSLHWGLCAKGYRNLFDQECYRNYSGAFNVGFSNFSKGINIMWHSTFHCLENKQKYYETKKNYWIKHFKM